MKDTSLFHTEEQVVRTAEDLIASGPEPENAWFAPYQELVSKYKNLLRHAKLLTNIGDLMQNALNAKNEELKSAQEREESLRAQLVHSQKMEAIGALTGGIAHDFNNLLTVINGYTEIVLLEKTEGDPSYADLLKVLESGRKGAELVKRLLAFSRKADISLRPQNLRSIVENSIKLIEGTFPKMIEIETIIGTDLGMVNVDAALMEQVVMNLCINAKEAMPEGGRLRIETRSLTVDDDYCRFHPGTKPGRTELLEVSDTGVGIDKETMDRLFDPFFTTKGLDFQKGTGLGLSVAKGIVEQHGGWITCESAPYEGTTFKIYLPAWETPTEETKADAETNSRDGLKKILLVDDEEFIRDLGARILDRSGYTVIAASDAAEALEIYAREQSNIALVLLDLVMPFMGGEQCLEALLKINPQAKVIISTGRSLDPRERLHLGAKATGFVNKPYQVNQLAETVRTVLEAAGPVE